jgi:hypothetical protein
MPVLFSEGEIYWATFSPIVEEVIRRKTHFRYITLEVHNSVLAKDNEYMHSKRISKKTFGFTLSIDTRAR